jgi:HPt (histidine-containing phosphotransfer) domain-containing protein
MAADRSVSASPFPAATEPESAATGLPDIAGIDRKQAEALLGNEREMFVELLRGFVTEYGGTPARIEALLAAGDRAAAAACLHKVRGTASYLGATEVVRSARQLEDALKAGTADVAGLVAEYAGCLGALLHAARPWLAGAA